MTPRQARQTLNMTQKQFAEALGVSIVTVGRWEVEEGKSSHRVPSRAILRHIALLLSTHGHNPE